MSTTDETHRPDQQSESQPATDQDAPAKQPDPTPPSAPAKSPALPPTGESGSDTAASKLSWVAIFAVILSSIAILASLSAFVLSVDILPGQGAVLGGAAVLVGGGLTYLASHQKRASDERIEARKYGQTARQISLAEGEAGRARAEFEKTLQTQLDAQNAAAAREQNRELRARFATATGLLSSGAYAAQLTGVHELAALADDWAEFGKPWERQVCIDLLCAQLRTPRVSKADDRARIEDDQFRTGIIRVIKGRTAMHPDTGDGPWQDCNFDLSDAELPKIELQNCRFRGELDFRGTTFTDRADFSSSRLWNTRFDNATFAGSAIFRSTTFGNRVSFEYAAFATRANFTLSKFIGNTDFSHAIVEDATLNFTNARFKPGSRTSMRHMELKGHSGLNFSTAWFSGGEVELRYIDFDQFGHFNFLHPQELKSVPRTDWEESAADLPPGLEPREWPPTLFVHPPYQADEPDPAEQGSETS
ncbi:pentapeptide repeat-containing protein [Rhodococcus sp. 008]|uniref:pentapeptide repeat-containing protein n=1 Tax=Rhodococcus sp. 008 TaxID=1723645 RepID=UPI0008062D47|nr:pentapeptide repeat-containing protein [Rhodococcus sp. 008]ANQ74435.1 hypothetical protein AOT96_29175 [Rhodococcus sp. 008]